MLVPDSRWRVDNWPIVARPPWTVAFAYDVSREGGREGDGWQEGGSRERVYRQGSPDPLASGPAKARDLIYEWDQTPEVVNGADWPSPVPLWYPVRPIVGWFLLSRPRLLLLFALSFSFSFLLLAQLLIWIPHHRPVLFLHFNFFLFSRSCLSLLPKTLWSSVACVLLGTYLSSIMRRRLSRDYCGQIGRVLLSS